MGIKSSTNEVTNRLRSRYGTQWRLRYQPQAPPRTPLGAIWRCIIEQSFSWPSASGLPGTIRVVWEDKMPGIWVEDPETFCLFLGRYPPAFVTSGVYARGSDPSVRRQVENIKENLYRAAPAGPKSGWIGALLGTAELLCAPAQWTPALQTALFEQTGSFWTPSPVEVAEQFLANPIMGVAPSVNTAEINDSDDMAALTLFLFGVTFEQMAQAHGNMDRRPDAWGAGRSAQQLEDAAVRGLVKALGSSAFFCWASGVDMEALQGAPSNFTSADRHLLNVGIRPDWDNNTRGLVKMATKKAIEEHTALRRAPNTPRPFRGTLWESVEDAIKDSSSHITYAFGLSDRFKDVTRRHLDVTARPERPELTPIPLTFEPTTVKQAPYPYTRPSTLALIRAELAKKNTEDIKPRWRGHK